MGPLCARLAAQSARVDSTTIDTTAVLILAESWRTIVGTGCASAPAIQSLLQAQKSEDTSHAGKTTNAQTCTQSASSIRTHRQAEQNNKSLRSWHCSDSNAHPPQRTSCREWVRAWAYSQEQKYHTSCPHRQKRSCTSRPVTANGHPLRGGTPGACDGASSAEEVGYAGRGPGGMPWGEQHADHDDLTSGPAAGGSSRSVEASQPAVDNAALSSTKPWAVSFKPSPIARKALQGRQTLSRARAWLTTIAARSMSHNVRFLLH